MIQNIIKGWKTTTTGIILAGSAIASVFYTKTVSWADAIVPISLGLGLIFSPDSIFTKLYSLIKSDKTDDKT